MALIQGDASEIDPLGCEDLAPSATCEVSSADVPGGAYCRITFKGRAKAIRAMISAYDLATGQIVAIEPPIKSPGSRTRATTAPCLLLLPRVRGL
jgi:hypothetical protein